MTIKLPEPVAAVLAKAGALDDLHPWAYRAVLLTGGTILLCQGLKKPRRQGGAPPAPDGAGHDSGVLLVPLTLQCDDA